jgi:hypothetical protein
MGSYFLSKEERENFDKSYTARQLLDSEGQPFSTGFSEAIEKGGSSLLCVGNVV